ncbi:hypothetical protein MPSEU_000067000 [Mayamaea pseudoterrestris]|nr:hypothetical protein MPSEU_000067000 [Mayamaea pseudoterrestris]
MTASAAGSKNVVRPPYSRAEEANSKVKVELRETDVLLGRGSVMAKFPGNVTFRCLLWGFRKEYQNAAMKDKSIIVDKVIRLVGRQTPPGRFLECSNAKGSDVNEPHIMNSKASNWSYHIAHPRRVYDKVSATLRAKLMDPFRDLDETEKIKIHRFVDSFNRSFAKSLGNKKCISETNKKSRPSKKSKGISVLGLTFRPRRKESIDDTASESSSSCGDERVAAAPGLTFNKRVSGSKKESSLNIVAPAPPAELVLQAVDVVCHGDAIDDYVSVCDTFPGNVAFTNFVAGYAKEYWEMTNVVKSSREQKMLFFDRITKDYAAKEPTSRFVVLVRNTKLEERRCNYASLDFIHTKIYSKLCLARATQAICAKGARSDVRQPRLTLAERTNNNGEVPQLVCNKRQLESKNNQMEDASASLGAQPAFKRPRLGVSHAANVKQSAATTTSEETQPARINLLAIDDGFLPEATTFFEWQAFMANAQEYLAAACAKQN